MWCFFEQFFAQNNSNVLVQWFFACFWHFKFFTQTDHFAKTIAHFSIIWCFLERFLILLYNCFWHVFRIFNCSKLTIFQRVYPLHGLYPTWPIFKLSHFSNIWCFFERFFAQNNSNVLVEWFFACFLHFKFLTQTDHFAKAIAFACVIGFARWPIFKIVSFLEYLVFISSGFLHRTNLMFL